MGKIARYVGNLLAFGSSATGTNRTLFADAPNQSDVLADNINADFLVGWENGLDPINGFPPQEYFNALGFTSTQLVAYLHQVGISEWDSLQEFYIGNVTNVAGVLYRSLTDANIGNDPADGAPDWQNISTNTWLIKDAAYTAKASEGVFADTSTIGAFTLTLPLNPSIGDRVPVSDFKRNFATANLTIGRNGQKINGVAADLVLDSNGYGAEFVFSNATEGWIIVNEVSSSRPLSSVFVSAAKAITQAGQHVIPHGLSSTPHLISLILKNKSAEHNYSLNDEIIVPNGNYQGTSSSNKGVSINVDSTNITIRFANIPSPFDYQDKNSGTGVTLSNASWDLFVRAWV